MEGVTVITYQMNKKLYDEKETLIIYAFYRCYLYLYLCIF